MKYIDDGIMRYIDHGYQQIMTFHRSPYLVEGIDVNVQQGRWLVCYGPTTAWPVLLPLAWELA